MSEEIVPYRAGLARHTQRSEPEQVAIILAPMFALFAVEKAIQRIYVERLLDIAAERLQVAVDAALYSYMFRPTIAELREFAKEAGEPGPRNDLTSEQIAARPDWTRGRLYRESDAERHERLRRTEKWGTRYGH